MKRAIWILLAISVSISMSSDLRANPDCTSYSGVFAPGTTSIRVYIHRNSIGFGPSRGLSWALNSVTTYTDLQIELAVIRAIQIMNEEVGGKIKLQYGGFVTSTAFISNAVLLSSNNPECAANDGSVPNSTAAYATSEDDSNGYKSFLRVRFFAKTSTSCSPIAWTLNQTESGPDFVGLLIHELGHNFYGMQHPTEDYVQCEYSNAYGTVMSPGIGAYQSIPVRVMKDFDKKWWQKRHGLRTTDKVYRSYKVSGTSWQSPFLATRFSGRPILQRPGSMGRQAATRVMGFQYKYGSVPEIGGGAVPTVTSYEGYGIAQSLSSSGSILRPLAVSNRPGTAEVVVAYIERANGYQVVGAHVGYICYRFSTNNGATFGGATCQNGWLSYRHGLTAAYDSYRQAYVFGYIGAPLASGTPGVITIGIVPSPLGSSVTTTAQRTSFNFESFHAPALACSTSTSDSLGCRAVWEGFDPHGCATTGKFGLTTSANLVFAPGAPDNTPCYPLVDTPGLTYHSTENAFYMAMLYATDTIYAYSMPTAGTDWSYAGTIWSVFDAYVSSPVLTFTTQVQAWFVRYN